MVEEDGCERIHRGGMGAILLDCKKTRNGEVVALFRTSIRWKIDEKVLQD